MLEKYSYDYEHDDRYCDPVTGVLRNKLNIDNERDLMTAEREITSMWLVRLKAEPVKGNFDLDHLRRIHRRIFSDIYSWAGNAARWISRKATPSVAMYISDYGGRTVRRACKGELPDNYARGGNSRKARVLSERDKSPSPVPRGKRQDAAAFTEYLGSVSGFHVDFSAVKGADEMICASADAFAKDLDRLNASIEHICTPITSRESDEDAITDPFSAREVSR